MRFQNRRVLVTGASRGAGAGIARAFAREGATVVLSARSLDKLEALKGEIEAAGCKAEVQAADLATREGAHDLGARCGEIDVLINNAALTGMEYGSVIERNDAFWDKTFNVDLFSPVALMQALGPGMVERGRGVILNISSISAQRGTPDLAPYAAAKAALDTVSRVAAMEFAQKRTGVRCNVIAFGFIDTEGLAQNCGDRDGAAAVAAQLSPLGRMVSVEEVAELCLYLASDAAAAILGTVVNIDGGLTAGMYAFAGSFQDSGDSGARQAALTS
jgi:NAD(P)-dependent dehydrogenase (short-subunit alcohol dehydrogenase family)